MDTKLKRESKTNSPGLQVKVFSEHGWRTFGSSLRECLEVDKHFNCRSWGKIGLHTQTKRQMVEVEGEDKMHASVKYN